MVKDDFTLDVIFGANTITTRAGDAIDFGTDISFVIAGEFNTEGVIFGTTEYTNSDTSTTSTGSLTGLIGAKGAVGAFISDSSNAAGDFAGGFVADNPNTGEADCERTGTPFNKEVCGGASIVRAQVCHDRATALPEDLPLDFDASTDCVGDVIVSICANTGAAYENIFDPLCNGDDGYTNARVAACNAFDEANRDGSCTQLLIDNCTEGNILSPACKPLSGTPASLWATNARNADNDGTLNVLDEVGLDDAYTNYVKGTETGLQLGAILEEGGTRKTGADW